MNQRVFPMWPTGGIVSIDYNKNSIMYSGLCYLALKSSSLPTIDIAASGKVG
jgi:hypothetical protein